MSKKVVQLVLLIAFVLGSSTVGLTQRLHPKLKKKEKTLQSVLLIPAKITISKDTVKGGESMIAESEALEKATQKLVFDALKAKGFNVVDSQLPSDASSNNEETRYAIADIQGKYDQLHTQVQRKAKDVEKGRFTLGEDVAKIHTLNPVDALVFVRGVGSVKTAGKAWLGALAGRGGVSFLTLSFGVVDAQTGEVLYFDQRIVASGLGRKKFHEKPDEALKKPVDKAFNKMPPPAQKAAL